MINAQRALTQPAPLTLLAAASAGAVGAGLSFLTAREPTLALALVAAVVVVAVCLIRVDVALLLLVATAPLEGAFAFGAGSQLTVAKLAGALAFGSFVLHAVAARRRLLFDSSHAIVVLILAIAVLSTQQAEDVSIALSTTLRYASFVALYIVVSQFVGDHALQRRIAWVLSIAGAVAAVLMIQNFLGGGAYAATLAYGNAVDSAFILATTLPLTFWLLRERLVLRLAALTMIAVISAAILFSFSRGAIVGLAAAGIVHVVTSQRHAFVVVAGVLAAVVATFALIRSNPEQVEAGYEGKLRVAEYNVESRLQAWRGATNLLEERPLLGVGPGNFRYHFYDAADLPPGTENVLVVHNAFLDVGAELGLVAMLLFVAYCGLMLWRSQLAVRERAGPPSFAHPLRLAFIVAVVGSLFLSEQYYAPLWLLGGLATALWRERRLPAEAR